MKTFSAEGPAAARVRSNRRITPADAADVRHIVLDLREPEYRYVEGQAIGVVLPTEVGGEHAPKVRYYAIASPSGGDDGLGDSVSVCVKRATEPAGAPTSVSHYVCDLEPGRDVSLVGPFGPSFPLPDDRSSPMVMVAAGTGVAPFRGLLAAMYGGPGWRGDVRLFHGVRGHGEALYREELQAYRDREAFRIRHAYSREGHAVDGHPCRVHHLIGEQSGELVELLGRPGARLYVCGVKGLEETVEAALAREGAWPEIRARLAAEGRLRIGTS